MAISGHFSPPAHNFPAPACQPSAAKARNRTQKVRFLAFTGVNKPRKPELLPVINSQQITT